VCGIAGIVGFGEAARFDAALLERLCDVLTHRGPDDRCVRIADFPRGGEGDPPPVRCGLANTRLSIIDLEGGRQPIANEDETCWVVNNGEIYNHAELRRRLVAAGHTFRTDHSDTEVLVHLYEEKGERLVEDLRGMFALAVWDGRRGRLLLARDRLGQKPLCYRREADRFLFASEIKALLQAPGVPRRVDREALFHYLTLQYVPHPWTMFQGVRKLPPGHRAVLDAATNRLRIEEYWRPPVGEPMTGDADALGEQLRALLTEATRYRLISDVPVGAFLSGGIDSSIVVGLMARLRREPVRTFTVSFEERAYDEAPHARRIAERFGTDHTELTVRPDALEVLPRLVRQYDEPFADSSAVPTWYVARATAEHVKVALTGDAGDENFAGYPRYRAVRLGAAFDRLPRWLREGLRGAVRTVPPSLGVRTFRRRLRRFMDALTLDPVARYLRWCAIFDDERKMRLCTPEFLDGVRGISTTDLFRAEYDAAGPGDFLRRTMFCDLRRYLPDDLNAKVDIAAMAHSLETRSPFLDHRVVEFAARVPVGLKLRGRTSKWLLKRTFADLLPREIRRRPKRGFGVPIAEWFRADLRGHLEEIVLSKRALERGYFNPDAVRTLVEEHVHRRYDHAYRLWSLLMLELWHRAFEIR